MAVKQQQKNEQIAQLEATVMALQDMFIRVQQLTDAAVYQLQELKSEKPIHVPLTKEECKGCLADL